MKTLLLMLMLLTSLTQSFSHGYSDPEEESWTDGRFETEGAFRGGHLVPITTTVNNSDLIKWFEPDPLQTMVKKMVRRPDQQQFFGLMGRRSSAKSQITRKRQKFQSFVGLMGKRSVEGSF